MDDIYVWLVVLFIVYTLPEVFGKGKKRKGKYKYPQVPDSPQSPEETKTQARKIPRRPVDYPGADYEYYPHAAKTVQREVFNFAPPEAAPAAANSPPPVVNTLSVTNDASPWQNALTPQVLANTVVFSEIISPPLARRPFGRRYGGNRL